MSSGSPLSGSGRARGEVHCRRHVVTVMVTATTRPRISSGCATDGFWSVMSDALRIRYTPRPDATAGGELSALTAVYRFILDCQAKKMGGPPTAPDDGTKLKRPEEVLGASS